MHLARGFVSPFTNAGRIASRHCGWFRVGIWTGLVVACFAANAGAQSTPDTFNPGADNFVYAMTVQPDGKIVVGGGFAGLGGGTGTTSRNFIGRLNADGSVDTGFNPGANGAVRAVAVQPDGKIVVAGDFTMLGGGGTGTTVRNFIGRLNADGSLDGSFNPGANDQIRALTVQADGKILVGGAFTMLGGGGTGTSARNRLGRLNADGTLDLSFNPGANDIVLCVQLQTDANILVTGRFTALGGGGTGINPRKGIGRLLPDGSIDTGFDPGVTGLVSVVAQQRDGKILVGGLFTGLGGGTGATARNNIGRLNADGSVDVAFDPGADNYVVSLALQSDQRIVVSGSFTTLGGGGTGTTARSHLGRLNADGSVDANFNPGANVTFVLALTVQPDGNILVGGVFSTLGGGGTGTFVRNNIGRLMNVDPVFQNLTLTGVGTVVTWTRTGAGPEIWRATFEWSTDGVTYSTLGSGTRTADGWQLTGLGLAVVPNLLIRARGYSKSGYENASSSITELVQNVTLPAAITGSATSIGQTTATLNGTAKPNGLSTTGKFEYGLTSAYGATTTGQAMGSGETAVPIGGGAIAGLSCNTLYHFRATANNASGTNNGLDATFTTSACPAPTVVTLAATSVTTTGATLNGTVNPNGGATTALFDYGPTTSYGTQATALPAPGSGSSPVAVSAAISGLSCNTAYHFRLAATNGISTNGSDLTFTTSACPSPTVVTLAATGITPTGATLNGTVNPNGSSTTARFDYGLTASYGTQAIASPAPGSGFSPVAVSAAISGLICNTTYHFRVVGINASTTNGSDLTFTTSGCPSTVVTLAATSITANGATLNGTVNPNGTSTTARFDYGLTTTYGSQATASPAPGSGTSPVAVSATITGLSCNTQYHFRVVGINASTTNGSDLTFTTAACPPPTVLSISPAFGPAAGGTPVTIVGTNFRTGATVALGGAAATSVVVVNATTITATTAAHAAGLVNVTVTNSDAQAGTLTGAYSYSTGAAPTITGITPATGSVDGGLSTTLTGTNFLVGVTVAFGGVSATVTLNSATSLTATTPAHAAAVVNVVVTNPDHQTATLTGGFTYTGGTTGGGGGGGGGGGAAPTPPPPPPTLLAPVNLMSSVSGSTVALSWAPPASGAAPTNYIIEAGSFSGGSDLAVLSTNSIATTFVANGVGAGTYYVRVRAQDSDATSAPSNEVLVVVGDGGPSQSGVGVPGAPGHLAISVSGSTVSLAWSAPTSGGAATAYLIEAGSAAGLSDLASFSTGTPATSLSVGNVPAGTYFVRVRGQNAAGTGAASNEVVLVVGSASVCALPPGAPSGLTVQIVGSTVTLNWLASAGTPTSFVIAAGSSPGGSDIAVVDTGSTATTMTATVGSGVYYVRVSGRNACGTSAPSNEVIIRVP